MTVESEKLLRMVLREITNGVGGEEAFIQKFMSADELDLFPFLRENVIVSFNTAMKLSLSTRAFEISRNDP